MSRKQDNVHSNLEESDSDKFSLLSKGNEQVRHKILRCNFFKDLLARNKMKIISHNRLFSLQFETG